MKPFILLGAGGSGGHCFPARALAEVLLARGYNVAIACDNRGEKYFTGMDDVEIHVLSSGTFKAGLKGKIDFILPLLKGLLQARRLIKKLKPAVAVGFGGYPSLPPLFIAQGHGIPTVLHEQNAVFGLANKLLAPWARVIALSTARTSGIDKWLHKAKLTGNPVRRDIAILAEEEFRLEGPVNLLIVGGSQGAKAFSDIIPDAIAALPEDLRLQMNVVQQVGEKDADHVHKVYERAGVKVQIRNFFGDMPEQLKKAHLLITRSGASTMAELTVAGRPAIYIPYPYNRDNQQVFNAAQVVDSGGGWLLEEKDLTAASLRKLLEEILKDPIALAVAAAHAKKLGQPRAAELLADQVESCIGQ